MPDFIFQCDKTIQEEMLNKLIEGDGSINCKNLNTYRYTTTSKKLATQYCLLLSLMGKDYVVREMSNDNPNWNTRYDIREVKHYQINQGIKDKIIEYIPYNGYVYDISVELSNNFVSGFGNVVLHNSFVKTSFDDEFSTMNTNVNGTHNILSAIKEKVPDCKFYFAASSEMYGKVEEIPQTELTKFHPRSVYGISKCAGYELTRHYREAYEIFACSGILFNHESERRGLEFVTRKITNGVAKIHLGLSNELILGNLEAKRDWGYAPCYVNAMQKMLQQLKPDDYIIATGETHSVQEFVELAFNEVGLNWKDYVKQDPKFMRPAEVDYLIGDYSKAKKILGWEPKVKFKELVKIMVDYDINRIRGTL